MLKVSPTAFAVACFLGLSDVLKFLGHLQMAVYPLGNQTASCNSPHDWLMCLAMALATLCDTYVEVKMAPMNAIWLILVTA